MRPQLLKHAALRIVETLNDRRQHVHIVAQARDFGRQPLQCSADIGKIDRRLARGVAQSSTSARYPPHYTQVARAGEARDARADRQTQSGRNGDAHPIGENRAKRMLKNNELVLCMGVNQLRTPNIAMIAAACGFDAVYIDLEHNPTSLETAAGVCVAALGMGITPIARVTSHDRA